MWMLHHDPETSPDLSRDSVSAVERETPPARATHLIAPGQRLAIRFELTDSSWRHTLDDAPDAAFLCGIVRLMGRRGRLLAATDYGPTDAYLHQLWQRQLDELLAAPPEGVSAS